MERWERGADVNVPEAVVLREPEGVVHYKRRREGNRARGDQAPKVPVRERVGRVHDHHRAYAHDSFIVQGVEGALAVHVLAADVAAALAVPVPERGATRVEVKPLVI